MTHAPLAVPCCHGHPLMKAQDSHRHDTKTDIKTALAADILEATVDPSHVGVLHKNWVGNIGELAFTADNTAPRYEVELQPYGLRAATLRSLVDSRTYVRVTELIFPFTSLIPPATMYTGDRLAVLTVPVDDEASLQIFIRYNVAKPIRHDDWEALPDPDAFAPVRGDRRNAWCQDRDAMQDSDWSGFDGVQIEDFVMSVSMGAIVDRTQEQLCSGDVVIVKTRRLFFDKVKAYGEAKTTDSFPTPSTLRHVRAWSYLISTDETTRWAEPEVLATAGVV